MSQGKIVLMACGSFSPPTYMHLRMFEIARDYMHSLGSGTVVGGVVSPVHDAYGKKDLVASHHRIAMLKLALRSSGWIKISEWETQQSGWTRTKLSLQYHQDTINYHMSPLNVNNDPPTWLPDDVLNVNNLNDNLNEKLNGNTDDSVTVKLLCGADLLESFATPGLWSDEDLETIVGRHGLVVVSRAGSDPGRFIYESDMLYKYRQTLIKELYYTLPGYSEYNFLSDLLNEKSPQDVVMTSPEEYKNILISIRDKPTIVDETITVKRPKLSNYLLPSRTDTISPTMDPKPRMAYIDKVSPTYIPGKAVKIVSDVTQHKIEKVSDYSSLDSYLSKEDFDVYKRRVSEGSMETVNVKGTVKKRCSASTIRKLKPDELKKSKSEVSKLCEKVKSIKLKDTKNYKTRSCNDIVKLILTKHGIHVISDTEAIV